MVLSSDDKIVLEGFLKEAEELDSPVMFLLHRIQSRWKRIPGDAARFIADSLNIPLTQVHFAASFYEEFTFEPTGSIIIRVCRGVVCHSKGSKKLLKALSDHLGLEPGETTEDGSITLMDSSCVGQCDGAPAMMVDDKVYRDLDETEAIRIINGIRGGA